MKQVEREMKQRIEQELTKVRREIVALRQQRRPEELEGGGDNTPLTEEVDLAQILEESDVQNEREWWLFERARALEEAERRIQRGEYGVCDSCGKRISRKRLEALPEAALCTECEELVETGTQRGRRPHAPTVEEWEESEEIFADKEEFDG